MKNINELSQKEFVEVMARQRYLDEEVLGNQLESKQYILWTWGGVYRFYYRNLWDYLILGDYAQEEPKEEVWVVEK
jgi:hypothetical protein